MDSNKKGLLCLFWSLVSLNKHTVTTIDKIEGEFGLLSLNLAVEKFRTRGHRVEEDCVLPTFEYGELARYLWAKKRQNMSKTFHDFTFDGKPWFRKFKVAVDFSNKATLFFSSVVDTVPSVYFNCSTIEDIVPICYEVDFIYLLDWAKNFFSQVPVLIQENFFEIFEQIDLFITSNLRLFEKLKKHVPIKKLVYVSKITCPADITKIKNNVFVSSQ